MGDINVDMAVDDFWTSELHTTMAAYGCSNHINTPTRITEHSAILFDVCISNLNTSDITTGVLSADISDHLPVYCLTVLGQPNAKKDNSRRPQRKINNVSLNEFQNLV